MLNNRKREDLVRAAERQCQELAKQGKDYAHLIRSLEEKSGGKIKVKQNRTVSFFSDGSQIVSYDIKLEEEVAIKLNVLEPDQTE